MPTELIKNIHVSTEVQADIGDLPEVITVVPYGK